MYIHIGGECVVRKSDIIGIFDLENTSVSQITREYLKTAEKKHIVENVSEELPKSFVVLRNSGGIRVYISPISAVTLMKRAENFERFYHTWGR